ncbi:outer envelope pore protein 16, chloroplastic-like isoform X1 [Actinidia eriantha]|uniref:outer envelope pore protein 16, chloroplastic-like isoform X1 n=1 Tax=Actinidia eriantha TaxID=165200 RepID=UPI0025882189|nr:outer envelope pore protein 16, chloroplastic-like isoform X1 [Actinidia eriantha]
MPGTGFRGTLTSPKVDLMVDMGHPFLNLTVDGFLKIGTVGAAKTAVEETYDIFKKGSFSKHKFEHSLKKMCKEGVYWGTIAGVYVGMEYGAERICGTRNWVISAKTAMIGGALTGALVSAATKNNRDKIVTDAITGGAVATAAKFLNYLT